MRREYLRPTGTTATSGAQYSPFFLRLTDNGTDYTLSENYASATDAYVEFSQNVLIYNLSIIGGDSTVAQTAQLGTSFFAQTALTNGLKFAVKDPSGNVVQDLTVSSPLISLADCLLFGNVPSIIVSLVSTTADNNEFLIGVDVNFADKFGAPLFVGKNHRFVCTLEDDFSGLDVFQMTVSGHYV